MTLRFACTMCGQCCHDLRLPLAIDEAMAWLQRGGNIQIFCEAIPWPDEPPASDLQAQHKRRRSFAAASAALPLRVIATLVAAFDGPCPNLADDLHCGIYDERPRVCRIYPAEINPFLELMPANKKCPPEAWSDDQPVFVQHGKLTDAATLDTIEASRAADARDATLKAQLCSLLGVGTTALANEGYVIHKPPPAAALRALQALGADAQAQAQAGAETHEARWHIASNQRATVETLASLDALGVHMTTGVAGTLEYLGLRADD
jgi:Fe-S-cluster containining protein